MDELKFERIELKEFYRDRREATILTFVENGWTVHTIEDEIFTIIVAERRIKGGKDGL